MNEQSDFDTSNIIKTTNRHNKDINYLKKKVSELEGIFMDDTKFAERFVSAQQHSVMLNEAINSAIDKYDKHLLIVKGVALGKWALALVIGGVIGWIINKAFTGS